MFDFETQLIFRTPSLSMTDSEEDHGSLINEALFLASPDLASLNKEGTESSAAQCKVDLAVTKYVNRMKYRSTPFGLFAGCGMVRWENNTQIILNRETDIKRCTKLDMHFLGALSQYLNQMPALRPHLDYFPNSSLYKKGGKIRYVEYYFNGKKRQHHLSEVEDHPFLDAIVNMANGGTSYEKIVSFLRSEEIDYDNAVEYLNELISNQILVSELEPLVTEMDFISRIINTLRKAASKSDDVQLRVALAALQDIKQSLARLDENKTNTEADYYHIEEKIKSLGVSYERNRLFQVDMAYVRTEGTLSSTYQGQLKKAIELLTLLPTLKNTSLNHFKNRFIERYAEQEIPLLEALDSEYGLGYGNNRKGAGDFNPALHGIALPQARHTSIEFDDWTEYLNDLLLSAKGSKSRVISLNKAEIEQKISKGSPARLPDTFYLMFSIQGEINEQEKLVFGTSGGSSGINLLSRFAHMNGEIRNFVQDIADKESQSNGEAILAEVIHLPDNRVGNILMHPPFRKYEIPFLAQSALDENAQIRLDDIFLSVKNNKLFLWSKSLGKEIKPRLSTAHNYAYQSLPIYHFLCDMQFQGEYQGLKFSWGNLVQFHSYFPRVEYGKVILSPETWYIEKKNHRSLLETSENETNEMLDLFRKENKIPDRATIMEGDNTLAIDFRKRSDINIFMDEFRKKSRLKLVEYLKPSSRVIKDTSDQTYAHEFIAVGTTFSKSERSPEPKRLTNPGESIQRTFPIGSEWLYYKFYCGNKTADEILTDKVQELVKRLFELNLIDQWFFIRFGDPDDHLRVRFHLVNVSQLGHVIAEIKNTFFDFDKPVGMWNTQIDTYRRELERYGYSSMPLSEMIFCYDSQFVVNLLSVLQGNEGEVLRWRFALRSVDQLLDCFELDLMRKKKLLEKMKSSFAVEFGMDRSLKKQIDDKYRLETKAIAEIIEGTSPEITKHSFLNKILREKVDGISLYCQELIKRQQQGLLGVGFEYLISSHVHMHFNRLFKSQQRFHELVLYDYLYRYYNSLLARNTHNQKQNREIPALPTT